MRKRNLVARYETWCDSSIKAGAILADILNDLGSPAMIGKVNKLSNRFDVHLKSLEVINDKKLRKYFMGVYYDRFKQDTHWEKLPKSVETHFLNMINAKFRKEVEKI